MSAQLSLTLTTPERQVLSITGDSVTLPTMDGEITVLPGHAPLVALIAPGMVTVRRGSNEEYLAVSGGFVQIAAGNTVTILADTAERADELDVAKIEEARERARKLLTEERRVDEVSTAAALGGLERELARLRVAQKHRTGKRPPQPNIEQ